MLCGTCPLSPQQILSLRTAYQAGAMQQSLRLRATINTDVNALPMPVVAGLMKSTFPLADATDSSDSSVGNSSTGLSPRTSQGTAVLWCNGRCDGLANTPQCTNICLVDWYAAPISHSLSLSLSHTHSLTYSLTHSPFTTPFCHHRGERMQVHRRQEAVADILQRHHAPGDNVRTRLCVCVYSSLFIFPYYH